MGVEAATSGDATEPPPPPRLLVFDLSGVICHWQPERRLAALAALSGRAPEIVHAYFWGGEPSFDVECDAGHVPLGAILNRVQTDLGIERQALLDAWRLAWEPDPAMLELVDEVVARRRVGVALFSNNGPTLGAALPAALPAVAQRFSLRLFSYQLGVAKPAPAAFTAAAARLGVPANRLLLIDDSPANVEGARTAGWAALRHASVAQTRASLADLLQS